MVEQKHATNPITLEAHKRFDLLNAIFRYTGGIYALKKRLGISLREKLFPLVKLVSN